MPKYGGRELPKRGFKGTSTGLPDDKAMRQWMPEVLFQPQEPGPVNRANCKPIEPTRCYDVDDMDVFRPMGPNDTTTQGRSDRASGGELPKFKRYHPLDWH